MCSILRSPLLPQTLPIPIHFDAYYRSRSQPSEPCIPVELPGIKKILGLSECSAIMNNHLTDICAQKRILNRAVIDTARIDESTNKNDSVSISKKAQDINSYAN